MTDDFKVKFIATIAERLENCRDREGNYNHDAMCYIADLRHISDWCVELLNEKIARSES